MVVIFFRKENMSQGYLLCHFNNFKGLSKNVVSNTYFFFSLPYKNPNNTRCRACLVHSKQQQQC